MVKLSTNAKQWLYNALQSATRGDVNGTYRVYGTNQKG